MIFSTYEFIFVFLPIVLIGYFLLSKLKNCKIQQIFLILASLFFYGYYNVGYLSIILISVIVNYLISVLISKKHKKWILVLGLIFNISLLGYFKYSNFFIDNFNHILAGKILLFHYNALLYNVAYYQEAQRYYFVYAHALYL